MLSWQSFSWKMAILFRWVGSSLIVISLSLLATIAKGGVFYIGMGYKVVLYGCLVGCILVMVARDWHVGEE
jgi:hypothetical protein